MFFEYFMILVVIPLFVFGLTLFITLVFVPCAFIFACWYMRVKERKLERRKRDGANVAFFHPYCNAGGGGERVLWAAVKAMIARYPDINIFIYTVDTEEPKAIFDKVQNTFNIKVDRDKISFIRLSMGKLIEASTYPCFTLLLQSLGSVVLGIEAFMKLNPDVYLETTGHAFTYPVFRYLAACPVGCYVHYPVVTSAMTRRVRARAPAHNHAGLIARNPILTHAKLLYYRVFGWVYGWAGRRADAVAVNGSWTAEHLDEVWRAPHKTKRVFPPCEVSELKKLRSLVQESDPVRILSVAQFRPEKDHPLMLQALYELRTLLAKDEPLWDRIRLVLAGSCRNAEDLARVQHLRDLAKHLALEDHVVFEVNVSYARLLQLYQTCTIGLHAMWNEHFGIGVVECMAAGLVTVAHSSGGPLLDLVGPTGAGLLAGSAPQYARELLRAVRMTAAERAELVETARASVERFSEAEFEKGFLRVVEPLMSAE